jgi:hypothetical protein
MSYCLFPGKLRREPAFRLAVVTTTRSLFFADLTCQDNEKGEDHATLETSVC